MTQAKEPLSSLALYIDGEGLHWMGFEGSKLVFTHKNRFTDIPVDVQAPVPATPGDIVAPASSRSASSGPAHSASAGQAASGLSPQGVARATAMMRSLNLQAAVKESLKPLNLKTARVGLCVSEDFSIFRYFSMPRIDKSFWRKAIPIEARKYVPFPLQDCLYDWRVSEVSLNEKPSLGVLFSAMRRDVFDAAAGLLASAGLLPEFVDSCAFAAARSIELIGRGLSEPVELDKQAVLAVYLDRVRVQILLMVRGVPVLARHILLTDAPNKGSYVLERRKLNLAATIDFARRQMGIESVNRILLLSPEDADEESLKNWVSGVSEETSLKVIAVRPITLAFEKGDSSSSVTNLPGWGELTNAGLGLRFNNRQLAPFELNLGQSAMEEPPKKTAMRKFWAAAAAAAGFVFLVGGWRQYAASQALGAVARRHAEIDGGLIEMKGKDDSALKALIDARKAALPVLYAMTNPGKRFYIAKTMAAVADSVPQAAWIESLDFKNAAAIGQVPAGCLELALKGKIESVKDKLDSEIIQEFFRQLKADEQFARSLPSGENSFQRDAQNGAGESAGGSLAMAAGPGRARDFGGPAQSSQGNQGQLSFTMKFKCAQ